MMSRPSSLSRFYSAHARLPSTDSSFHLRLFASPLAPYLGTLRVSTARMHPLFTEQIANDTILVLTHRLEN